jgi:hypothetical protein
MRVDYHHPMVKFLLPSGYLYKVTTGLRSQLRVEARYYEVCL